LRVLISRISSGIAPAIFEPEIDLHKRICNKTQIDQTKPEHEQTLEVRQLAKFARKNASQLASELPIRIKHSHKRGKRKETEIKHIGYKLSSWESRPI